MEYLKQGAKEGARMATAVIVKYAILGAIVLAIAGGGGYWAYSVLRAPYDAAKTKVIDAKNAVRDTGQQAAERTREVGTAAKEATIRTKDAIVDTTAAKAEQLREKTPELIDKGRELSGTALEKTKTLGSGALERLRTWRSGAKPDEQQ